MRVKITTKYRVVLYDGDKDCKWTKIGPLLSERDLALEKIKQLYARTIGQLNIFLDIQEEQVTEQIKEE